VYLRNFYDFGHFDGGQDCSEDSQVVCEEVIALNQGWEWIRMNKRKLRQLIDSYYFLIDGEARPYAAGDLLKQIHEEILYHYAALAVAAVEEVRESEEEETAEVARVSGEKSSQETP